MTTKKRPFMTGKRWAGLIILIFATALTAVYA